MRGGKSEPLDNRICIRKNKVSMANFSYRLVVGTDTIVLLPFWAPDIFTAKLLAEGPLMVYPPVIHLIVGCSRIPCGEGSFQPLYGMVPFSGCGLTNCVLVAEKSCFIISLLAIFGIEPFDTNKMLSLF